VHYETVLTHTEGCPLALPSIFGITIDSDGARELLNSPEVAAAIRAAAHQVAEAARAQGRRVTDGEPLPVDVIIEEPTGRVSATVTIAHASGVGMEATHGVLKRAAEAAGFEVTGLDPAEA
jgi:glycerate kinase